MLNLSEKYYKNLRLRIPAIISIFDAKQHGYNELLFFRF
jgi:hypothetical protein